MKKYLTFFLIVVLLTASQIFAQQWWNEGLPAFSAGEADTPQL